MPVAVNCVDETRVVVSVAREKMARVFAAANQLGVAVAEIGTTGGKSLVIRKHGQIRVDCALSDIRSARESCLEPIARE